MYRFNISAPGMVFLHGEHAVRYDKTCVAASLNLRTQLTFSSMPLDIFMIDYITIIFPNIDLYMRIPLHIFVQYFYDADLHPVFTDCSLRSSILDFISLLKFYTDSEQLKKSEIQLCLQAFLYLLVTTCYIENINIRASFKVELSTQLPIGQGLGSSASLVVCLAACFWRWSLLQKGIVRYEFTDNDLKNIKNYAYNCENNIYGATSPINTIVSTYGSVVTFKDEHTVNSFLDIPSMSIVLVYSNVNQNTEAVQKTVLQEKKKLFSFVDSILDSIDNVSTTSIQMLNEIQKSSCNLNQSNAREVSRIPLDSYRQILSLIQMNQGLLKTLGMSHPNLDIICAIAKDFSLAGKLTGNGGGGYAFILLLPDSIEKLIDDLLKQLKSHNFSAKITSLCCEGVRVE